MAAPKLEVTTSTPLKAGTNTENAPSAKAENFDTTTTSTSDVGVVGKSTPSSGMHLPSSQADYLNNPQPPYPALSLRLRETGQVVVRVLIGKSGQALRGDVFQSSGFERLDRAALKATLSWRYVPGKVDGQAQDMWFDVPITFKLPN